MKDRVFMYCYSIDTEFCTCRHTCTCMLMMYFLTSTNNYFVAKTVQKSLTFIFIYIPDEDTEDYFYQHICLLIKESNVLVRLLHLCGKVPSHILPLFFLHVAIFLFCIYPCLFDIIVLHVTWRSRLLIFCGTYLSLTPIFCHSLVPIYTPEPVTLSSTVYIHPWSRPIDGRLIKVLGLVIGNKINPGTAP